MQPLRAPFPYFGGKSRVASEIWSRFGSVPNYVEPFAGSLAVLLSRPDSPAMETVNDVNGHVVNFWRSVKLFPEETARFADWPVFELDKHARMRYVHERKADLTAQLEGDPEYCDPQVAGWWVWLMAVSIATGALNGDRVLPNLGARQGVVAIAESHPGGIRGAFDALARRLRRVRVCCGDWRRVLTPVPTVNHGVTAVLLDPPYDTKECTDAYGTGSNSDEVRAWAVEHGSSPLFRIALCGYSGEHELPTTWDEFAWKATGGFGNAGNGRGRANASRERIWFSPHCLRPGLFG